MRSFDEVVDSLTDKLAKLKVKHQHILEENEKLRSLNQKLNEQLSNKEKRLIELNNINQANNTVGEALNHEEDSEHLRLKVNEMVREVDQCIALLDN